MAAPTSTDHQNDEEPVPGPAGQQRIGSRKDPYIVQSGETLTEIAEKLTGNPYLFQAIAEANGIEGPEFRVNAEQPLIIPDFDGLDAEALAKQGRQIIGEMGTAALEAINDFDFSQIVSRDGVINEAAVEQLQNHFAAAGLELELSIDSFASEKHSGQSVSLNGNTVFEREVSINFSEEQPRLVIDQRTAEEPDFSLLARNELELARDLAGAASFSTDVGEGLVTLDAKSQAFEILRRGDAEFLHRARIAKTRELGNLVKQFTESSQTGSLFRTIARSNVTQSLPVVGKIAETIDFGATVLSEETTGGRTEAAAVFGLEMGAGNLVATGAFVVGAAVAVAFSAPAVGVAAAGLLAATAATWAFNEIADAFRPEFREFLEMDEQIDNALD